MEDESKIRDDLIGSMLNSNFYLLRDSIEGDGKIADSTLKFTDILKIRPPT